MLDLPCFDSLCFVPPRSFRTESNMFSDFKITFIVVLAAMGCGPSFISAAPTSHKPQLRSQMEAGASWSETSLGQEPPIRNLNARNGTGLDPAGQITLWYPCSRGTSNFVSARKAPVHPETKNGPITPLERQMGADFFRRLIMPL